MDNALEQRRGGDHRRDRLRRRRVDVERRYSGGDPVMQYRIARAHADMARHRFANAGLRIRPRGAVHAVRWRVGENGVEHPAPACHTGNDRPDGDPSIQPVYDQPVSCRLCLTRQVAHDDGQSYIPAAGQYQLYDPGDGVPALAAFPPAA